MRGGHIDAVDIDQGVAVGDERALPEERSRMDEALQHAGIFTRVGQLDARREGVMPDEVGDHLAAVAHAQHKIGLPTADVRLQNMLQARLARERDQSFWHHLGPTFEPRSPPAAQHEGLEAHPSTVSEVSRTINGGRPWVCSKTRPTYSLNNPMAISCTLATKSADANRLTHPGGSE